MEFWIEIDPTGNKVTVEGKSADLGGDCTALTKEIEEALGARIGQKVKPEFHRTRTIGKKVGS